MPEPLERCDCKQKGVWGATGVMPSQHTFQPLAGGAYLAHLHKLSLEDLVRLYGLRCAEVAVSASDRAGIPPFEASNDIMREISRRWDELVIANRNILLAVQDLKVNAANSLEQIRKEMDHGRS